MGKAESDTNRIEVAGDRPANGCSRWFLQRNDPGRVFQVTVKRSREAKFQRGGAPAPTYDLAREHSVTCWRVDPEGRVIIDLTPEFPRNPRMCWN